MSGRFARLAAVFAGGAVLGVLAATLMPRGPVTTAQAVALVPLGLCAGLVAGRFASSRWAMVALPLGYALAFELTWSPSVGMTVDLPSFSTAWGVVALLLGRGVHALLVLPGALFGVALGAAGRRPAPATTRRRRQRVAARVLVAGALVALVAALLRPATTPALVGGTPPGGIASLERVTIGGVEQWISLRGHDRDAPVLLYLPGGPGQSDLALSRATLEPLTRDFVVVAWDGRGIGKAYPQFDAAELTVERTVADTLELTDLLRRRFDEEKIYLLGESGGSVTGVLAVQRAPERFHAWLGSGQMVDPHETDRRIRRDLLAAYARSGDTALADELRSFGEPPYEDPYAWTFVLTQYPRLEGDYDPPAAYERRGRRAGVGFFGIGGAEYRLIEKVGVLRGLMDVFSTLYPRWSGIDFRRQVPRLEVPVLLFTGDHELAARRDLAVDWFDELDAPLKRLYRWPDAGHATVFEHADDVRRILRDLRAGRLASG